MIRKSELIKMLQKIEGDPVIVMSKDSEGNGYSPLSDLEDGFYYYAESTWEGYITEEQDVDEEDLLENDEWYKCIVFNPVN